MNAATMEALRLEKPTPPTLTADQKKAELILYLFEEERFYREWPELAGLRFSCGVRREADHAYSGR